MRATTPAALAVKVIPAVAFVATIVPIAFTDLAATYGVTQEYLLSLAAIQFAKNAPAVLPPIHADGPLDEQECATCPLCSRCGSQALRSSRRRLCFEALAPLVA